ncbi:MAG: sodium:proton antiporter [Rhodospirillales bacterium]|nr:sodium:proton antiporter [Rhodospirillales bacterium]
MQESADFISGAAWALPFAGLLASFALGPLVWPHRWHRWEGRVAAGWALALALPLAVARGPEAAWTAIWQEVLGTYLPFASLLLALYAAGGGVLIRGVCRATPAGNTAFLALGTLVSGLIGTVAASMLLIHPMLAANAHRRRRFHLVLGFIILVANAGGALTPLGPPLYLGFLAGDGFFWPLLHLGPAVALLAGIVLGGVYATERYLARGEAPPPPRAPLRLRGAGNLALIGAVVGAVFAEGAFPGNRLALAGATIPAAQLAGAGFCLIVAAVSAEVTPRAIRAGNDFAWAPMVETAGFFLALFVTLVPVAPMLAGAGGRLGPQGLFWLTGALSAMLDNAPSYLMARGLADGTPGALAALSAGAVFFGGLTYLGNAPNLMLRAVAAHRGVRMPGFLAYAAIACAVLGPVLALLALVWVG